MALKDKGGDNALTHGSEGREHRLKAKTKLTLSAGDTTVELDASGTLTEKAKTKISMEAATVEEKGTAQVSVQGKVVEVKADATMTLQASGPQHHQGGHGQHQLTGKEHGKEGRR